MMMMVRRLQGFQKIGLTEREKIHGIVGLYKIPERIVVAK
jgi:hypothetical protein